MIGTLTLTPIAVPRTIDGPDARDFVTGAEVLNRSVAFDIGSDHLRRDAAETLPGWQDQTDTLHGGLVARRDEVVVGALIYEGPQAAAATELEFELGVAPESRGTGIETALLAALEEAARLLGRTTLQTYATHATDTGLPMLPSPTGFGGVPLDEQTRVYQEHGFTLQQVERNSAFPLAGDLTPVRERLASAEAFAGPDYRTVTWSGRAPAEYVAAFAFALSRMSTDVPSGGLTITEEAWDAGRVRRREARLAAAGMLVSVAAVVHEPTGTVVAYNELAIGSDRTRPIHQWGTLVVREHRGRRLGTIVTCANILHWRETVPTSPFISTFNAEENRPMLDVNEALGFTPIAIGGAWQRTLD